jgi:hypothetical protein
MQLRISPDDLAAAAARLSDDGPALRGLAALVSGLRSEVPAGAAGHPAFGAALTSFLESQVAALATLAQAADVLTFGLSSAAQRYRSTDAHAGLLFGGFGG